MKTDHPNAKMMREAMEQMREEGPTATAEFMAEDIVWHEVGNPEPIRGRQAVVDKMAEVSDRVTFDFDVYSVLADDHMGVVYGGASLQAEDRSTRYDAVEIHRFRDGKLAERWAMVGDMKSMEEFWAGL